MTDVLTGVFNITPTPFHPDGTLDLDSLTRLTGFTRDAGVNGMGNRPAPFQTGGHEPTGGWGNGNYQGANSQSATPPGAAGVNGNSASRGGWGGGFQGAETARSFGS